MEKKFTGAMVCKEFKSKCRECPLHRTNNFKSLPCSMLTDDDIQFIMKDYPYADVKIRIIFNDIETRLTAVEKKVENNVSVEFKPERVIFGCSYNRNIGFSAEVVDQKLYDKLEAKHEADCRLISEYDLENKKLENEISVLNKQIDSFSLTCRLYKKENEDLKCDVERWVKRYEHNRDMDKKRIYDLNNVENERNYYKGLYSSKCDDYDKLLEKQIKTEKELKHAEEERDHYKSLYSFKCDDYNKLLEENNRLSESNDNATKENFILEGESDALSTRNAFLESKVEELKKTIESKDREIGLLRAELDKYKTDDECDDRWID